MTTTSASWKSKALRFERQLDEALKACSRLASDNQRLIRKRREQSELKDLALELLKTARGRKKL